MYLNLFLVIFVLTQVKSDLILKKHGPPDVDAPKLRVDPPTWGTIQQRVDHFNPKDARKWEMRYLESGQFFEENGPMFIYLGGEWSINMGSIMSGQIVDMALEHRGYLFYTEHRYYGQSFPTEDLSPENLQYLNVDQALADVVYFINYKKETIPGLKSSKVVVVGGSYSASMATWLRLKYPHAIDIAYASSGPLRAVADFHEYYEVINDNIKLVNSECLQTINDGTNLMEKEMETEDGLKSLSERLGMCNTLKNEEPHRSFFFNMIIAETFAGLVQYAGQYSIQNDCDKLMGFDGDALNKLIGYIKDNYKDVSCIGDYDEFIETYSSHETSNDIYRQWIYQTCTEYGYFQTTTSQYQPFGDTFPLNFFVDMCPTLFGERFNETVLNTAVRRTNLFYGSIEPEITKLISVHGSVDPWHPLGILSDLSPLAPAIFIEGSSHCADLKSVSEYDIPALREAKIRIKGIIAEWLKE
ncbi:putative serine protease K12H4.7 [Onthophagus taurus]|uniref:putative serine protease K12H4.7 n=1 Tax=Onthophagus taurus TaxID=166361 RepID=UPI0039BE500B